MKAATDGVSLSGQTIEKELMNRPFSIALLALMLCGLGSRSAFAVDLLKYNICSADYPVTVAGISNTTQYSQLGSYTVQGCDVSGTGWTGANSFLFSFKVQWGFAVRVDSFAFSSTTSASGPNEYGVDIYADNLVSGLTGGWRPMPGHGTGVATPVVANHAAPISNITGHVTIFVAGRGASSSSATWRNRDMTLIGTIYALPGTPVPHVPRFVQASDGTHTDRVAITWSPADGATGYRIWRGTNSSMVNAVMLGASVTTNYDDNTATAGYTNYHYGVTATNTGGSSVLSAVNRGYRLGPPMASTNVLASDGTYSDRVRVSWVSVADAAGYEIWRNGVSNIVGATNVGVASQFSTSYDDTSVGVATMQYYWVRATNAAGPGPFAGANSGYRNLSYPFSVNASDGMYGDRIVVTWGSTAAATGYELWRGTNSTSSNSIRIGSTNALSFDDISVGVGTTYYYWVKGFNVVATSDYSFYDTGYVLSVPSSPTNVTSTDGAYTDRIRTSWSTVTNAGGYDIWRNTVSNSAGASLVASVSRFTTAYDDYTAGTATRLYYWVRATNAAGISLLSGGDPGYRNFSPPTGVSATDGTHGDRVAVTWSTNAGASGYEIWRGISTLATNAILVGVTNAPPFNDYGAGVGTSYYYWVKSSNSVATSAFSLSYDTGYRFGPPLAPSGTAASDGTFTNMIRVSWSASAGATGYEIWRNPADDFPTATKVAVDGASPYDDTGLLVGTQYYYWVSATNSAGASPPGANDTGYVQLSAPTSVTATDGTLADRVTVAWNTVTGAKGYQVWRGTNNNAGSATNIGHVTAPPYDDMSAQAGTNYYYWVKATNHLTVGGFSASDLGYRAGPPATPSGVSATDGTYTNRIRISWTEVPGAVGYEIWRNSNSNLPSASRIATPLSSPYDDSPLLVGTQYHYWVKATNSTGISAASASDAGFIQLSSPTGVTASDGTPTNRVVVAWSPVNGAQGYQIWRGTNANVAAATNLGGVVASPYDDFAATSDIVYYYWVRATNVLTTSAYSLSNTGYRTGGAVPAPVNVVASDGIYTDRVTIVWSASGGASGYEVWRNNSNHSPSATLIGSSVITGFSDYAAAAGVLYHYWIRATNAGGVSSLSLPDSGYVMAVLPPQPTNKLIVITSTDRGWYDSAGSHTPSIENYLAGKYASKMYRNWFIFSIPAFTGTVIGAEFRIRTHTGESPDSFEDYQIRAVTTAAATVQSGISNPGIYQDLGDGAILGTYRLDTGAGDRSVGIVLNREFVTNVTPSTTVVLGGSFISANNPSASNEYAFGRSHEGTAADAKLLLTVGTNRPAVEIVQAGQQMELIWGVEDIGVHVQQSVDLTDPNGWTNAYPQPVVIATNGQNKVVLPGQGPGMFMRITYP